MAASKRSGGLSGAPTTGTDAGLFLRGEALRPTMQAARERIWNVARSLERRRDWGVDDAGVERRWRVDRRGVVSAYASFFFERPEDPGPAMAVVIKTSSPALDEDVQRALGVRYARRSKHSDAFSAVLRSRHPTPWLDELARLDHVFGDATSKPKRRSASRWSTLLATSPPWAIGSVSFWRRAGDAKQHVGVGLALILGGTHGNGVAAHVSAWPRRDSRRWTSLRVSLASSFGSNAMVMENSSELISWR